MTRYKSRLILGIIVFSIVVGFFTVRARILNRISKQVRDYSWTDNTCIAHALGGVDGYTYLNCREGLLNSYQKGFRVFETDLHMTSEGVLVLYHDIERWSQMTGESELNYETFKNTLLYDRYHTLCLNDLLAFMNDHKDCFVIFDWGAPAEGENLFWYSGILFYGSQYEGVLDRVILEIKNPSMFNEASRIYDWKAYTLSYYDDEWNSVDEAVVFCKKNGIKVVDIPVGRCNKDFVELWVDQGIDVYCYTVNDINDLSTLLENGVKGCYTDYIMP